MLGQRLSRTDGLPSTSRLMLKPSVCCWVLLMCWLLLVLASLYIIWTDLSVSTRMEKLGTDWKTSVLPLHARYGADGWVNCGGAEVVELVMDVWGAVAAALTHVNSLVRILERLSLLYNQLLWKKRKRKGVMGERGWETEGSTCLSGYQILLNNRPLLITKHL